LALSLGAVIAIAQVVRERPAAGTVDTKVLVLKIQDIELTDDQEARIAAIRKEYQPKNKENAKELKTLVDEELNQIRNVLTPEQREKLPEIIAERREFKKESLAQAIAGLEELDLTEAELAKIAEIRKQFRPRMEAAVKQLDGLLTADQKKARKEAIKADKSRREVLQAVNITGAQRAELESVGTELKDLVGTELTKIRAVLTPEQRETLQDLRAERKEMVRDRLAHAIAERRDLNLTDQQRERLMSIRQEYRPKIQAAGDQLRASISEEVGKIVTVLKPTGVVAERPERVE
jgi:Spy/CpxP family protein refolding chaperone